MSGRVFVMHPPRDDFIPAMTDAERSASGAHAAWLRKLLADGTLIAAGPCLGQGHARIAIFEAPDEQPARSIVAAEPVTGSGHMRGNLRPYRLGLLHAVTRSRQARGRRLAGPVAVARAATGPAQHARCAVQAELARQPHQPQR